MGDFERNEREEKEIGRKGITFLCLDVERNEKEKKKQRQIVIKIHQICFPLTRQKIEGEGRVYVIFKYCPHYSRLVFVIDYIYL